MDPRPLVVAVLVFAGCSSSGDDEDVLGDRACREFFELADDAKAGVVLPAELADRARSIYETADLSTDPAIETAAKDLAAAAVGTDTAAQTGAVAAFDAACR